MAADDILDHGGEDFEAVVADDHPLDPGVEVDKAVLVQIAHVAGVGPHPAVGVAAQQDGGLLGFVVVALHQAGAGDAQLAPLADGQLLIGARLKGRHHGVHHGDAHTAGLVVQPGGHRGCRGHFSHAVALGNGVPGPVGSQKIVDGLLGPPGEGVAAGGVVGDERKVLVPQLGVCGQLLVVGGHAEHMLGLVLQHQTAQLGRVEIRDDDDREAQHQGQMDAAGKAVGDKGGHHVHQLLPPVEQLGVSLKLQGDAVEAVVRQHDPLGGAGGAAGVYHHAGMVWVVGLGGSALVLAPCHKLLPADDVGSIFVLVGGGQLVAQGHGRGQRVGRGEDDDLFHIGAPGSLAAAVVHHVQADQQVGVHLLNVLTDAFDAVAGVHQIQGGSHHVGGIKQGDDLRGHDADHRDDVALFHPGAPQGGGGLFYVDDEVGVGELAAVVFQSRVVQVVLAPLADILKGREGRQGLIDEFLVVILEPGFGLGCINRILRRHQFLIPLCL